MKAPGLSQFLTFPTHHPDMASTRQLAAIMFADIVGYTSLVEKDEELAQAQLEKFRQTLHELVPAHQGKLFEVRGDGALCAFSSTLEGVKAALSIQLAMRTPLVVPVRIGIHTGDVVISEGNIYGDGVNIASRMETLAVEGSIVISSRVHEDIKNQKELECTYLGDFQLKNVKDKISLYAINHPVLNIPEAIQLTHAVDTTTFTSILVLPFINMSLQSEQDYFSDGLTEELIASLSRLRDIRVISRTTSMQYKGSGKSIQDISRETGATYILEGSVRQRGDQLRISAQFIDAKDDLHLWADNYGGTLEDIFDIQESVAGKIVEALRLQLSKSERDSLQKRSTENTEAYQLYLQGRFSWNKRNEDGLRTAIRFFEQAIEKDPGFALAWTGLADSHGLLGDHATIRRVEIYPKMKEAVQHALDLDPQLAEAHISLGLLHMLDEWDWENAGKEFRLGIELNPNYATGHHWYGEWLLYMGYYEEAQNELIVACDLDPVSQAIWKDKGLIYYYSRNYDVAIEAAQKAMALDPGVPAVYRLLSMCYAAKGMYDQAIKENKRWGELSRNPVKLKLALAHIYAMAGRKEDALMLLDEILKDGILTGNDLRGIALVYAALPDPDKAIEWLDAAYEKHEASLSSIKVDPKFDLIRNDPRFQKLVEKIGLNTLVSLPPVS